MKLLLAGDSITEGKIGQNYLDLMCQKEPTLSMTNLGLGGDTLLGIEARTLKHLEKSDSYDAILIAAGHNDIIVPTFEKMGFVHKQIASTLRKRGSLPSESPEVFKKNYLHFIEALKKRTSARVLLTTISCLNEDLSADTNLLRFQYNDVIREVAQSQGCILCDVGAEFDAYLRARTLTPYFMDGLWDTFIFDAMKSKSPESTLALSQKRGLHLTVDGVHLNARGAEIYAEVILEGVLGA